MQSLLLVCAVALAACGQRTVPYQTAPEPVEQGYLSAVPAGSTDYNNEDLADLFVRLTHGLEGGGSRKALQRFEDPIRVGMVGPASEQYREFLETLLDQIRTETGIAISTGAPPHNMLIRMVPGAEFLSGTSAQCFILFAQPTWDEFVADPMSYASLTETMEAGVTEVGIMIPDTVEPYKVRECLLEEVTQALGPANDLYGLSSSIFNDDDAHTWPTRLDYLMLKVLYDDRLYSGLNREETRTIARIVLEDLNPEGRDAQRLSEIQQESFKDWRETLHGLVDDNRHSALQNVRRLADEARRKAPNSAYDCTGAMILAFVTRNIGQSKGTASLDNAMAICAAAHGSDDVRIAALKLNRAYALLENARYGSAKAELEAILPVFLAHGLEDEIADSKIALARAAVGLKTPGWEKDELVEAQAWAAFAFGADHEITAALIP